MFVVELCTCCCNRGTGSAGNIQFDSNDRWPFGSGSHVDFPISTTRSRFYAICQEILQAHLGSLLFGIWTLHPHLKHGVTR